MKDYFHNRRHIALTIYAKLAWPDLETPQYKKLLDDHMTFPLSKVQHSTFYGLDFGRQYATFSPNRAVGNMEYLQEILTLTGGTDYVRIYFSNRYYPVRAERPSDYGPPMWWFAMRKEGHIWVPIPELHRVTSDSPAGVYFKPKENWGSCSPHWYMFARKGIEFTFEPYNVTKGQYHEAPREFMGWAGAKADFDWFQNQSKKADIDSQKDSYTIFAQLEDSDLFRHTASTDFSAYIGTTVKVTPKGDRVGRSKRRPLMSTNFRIMPGQKLFCLTHLTYNQHSWVQMSLYNVAFIHRNVALELSSPVFAGMEESDVYKLWRWLPRRAEETGRGIFRFGKYIIHLTAPTSFGDIPVDDKGHALPTATLFTMDSKRNWFDDQGRPLPHRKLVKAFIESLPDYGIPTPPVEE